MSTETPETPRDVLNHELCIMETAINAVSFSGDNVNQIVTAEFCAGIYFQWERFKKALNAVLGEKK